MVTFYFENLTLCPVANICPVDTKASVVSSGKVMDLFAFSDEFGMMSDA